MCDIFEPTYETLDRLYAWHSPASHQSLGLVPFGVSLDSRNTCDFKRNPDHALSVWVFIFHQRRTTDDE
jgi:hypothetical protein